MKPYEIEQKRYLKSKYPNITIDDVRQAFRTSTSNYPLTREEYNHLWEIFLPWVSNIDQVKEQMRKRGHKI